MKTVDVIATIDWVEEHVGSTTKEFLFSKRLYRDREVNGSATADIVLRIVGEIAVTGQLIAGHPFARKVLEAFGITDLFDVTFINRTLIEFLGKETQPRGISEELWILLSRWEVMAGSSRPFSVLAIPPEVLKQTDFDDILTIQIVREGESLATLDSLQSVVADINKLYEAFALLDKSRQSKPLEIVHIASGSSLRIDLKGLAEAVKHLKSLLVEGWSLWRHRKATELTANSRALLSSLKTFKEIDKLAKDGSMSEHDAVALKAKMQKSMLNLFGEGALPREIPTVESVPNHLLIELSPQKLLPSSEFRSNEENTFLDVSPSFSQPKSPVRKGRKKIQRSRKKQG